MLRFKMFRRLGNAAFGSAAPGAPSAEQGTPLELISYNTATKRFELGTEALNVLRKITTPVAVVAVSGRARQGKSFILNQLLGRSTGFVVGPTVRPCTKVCTRAPLHHVLINSKLIAIHMEIVLGVEWRCMLAWGLQASSPQSIQ